MRQVTTIEELEALPEGAEVRVQLNSGDRTTTVWRRNAKGFGSEGSTLQTRFFTGYVNAGRVHVTEPNKPSLPGDWWQMGRYHYLHLYTESDGRMQLLEFYRHNFRQVNAFPPNFFEARETRGMTRLSSAPDEVSLIGQHVDQVMSVMFRYIASLA